MLKELGKQKFLISPQQMIPYQSTGQAFRVGAKHSNCRSVYEIHDCNENRVGNTPEGLSRALTRDSYVKGKGFSLMELMIAVVILGILTAIAYPTYTEHVQRTRRSDGQATLLTLATHMEHYYTENNTYVGASTPADVSSNDTSPEGYYQMSISNLSATTYTLTATPVAGGPQESDSCGALTLTNLNVKGPNAGCW